MSGAHCTCEAQYEAVTCICPDAPVSGEAGGLEAAAAVAQELRLWLDGQRSTNNFIRGTLGNPYDGPQNEAETRLIWESDNARIVALAAELNYLTAAADVLRAGVTR